MVCSLDLSKGLAALHTGLAWLPWTGRHRQELGFEDSRRLLSLSVKFLWDLATQWMLLRGVLLRCRLFLFVRGSVSLKYCRWRRDWSWDDVWFWWPSLTYSVCGIKMLLAELWAHTVNFQTCFWLLKVKGVVWPVLSSAIPGYSQKRWVWCLTTLNFGQLMN